MRKCIFCGEELCGHPMTKLVKMPEGAQIMPLEEELEKDGSVDLVIYQCKYCGLVQLDIDPIFYYKDAIRVGNTTSTMKQLRKEENERLINQYNMKDKKVIEIGCSTGEYVDMLKEYGMEAYGLEHSMRTCESAHKRGTQVINGYVTDENYVINPGTLFDGFVCYNFLEHQPQPLQFLKGIYNNLKEDGIGVITVPDFGYMLEHSGIYEVIRDHLAYYTKKSFYMILSMAGFEVDTMEIINNDTIRAFVRKRQISSMQKQADEYVGLCDDINEIVCDKKKSGSKIAVWGASHQCFTILSATDLGDEIEYIIDSAEIKQNRFSPVTHKPIVSPDYLKQHPVDMVIITAPGYAKEIHQIIIDMVDYDIQVAVLYEERVDFV